MLTLGAMLLARRRAAGLSQRRLAALIGCSHPAVCKYERGKVKHATVALLDKWVEVTAKGVR